MKHPDAAQRAALRDLLTLRLAELHEQLREDEPEESAEDNDVADWKDRAASSRSAMVRDAEHARDRRELAQIEAALWTFDHGGYGICTTCGEAIGVMRLMAQPAATHCAACQTEREQARAVPRH